MDTRHVRSGSRRRGSLAGAAMLAVALCPALAPSPADAKESWTVHGKLFGKPGDAPPDMGDKAEDISGIACATTRGFPRVCLIADDESQGVQVIILRDGDLQAGPFIRLTYDVHRDKPLELDAEAVAYADGAFYVSGSHGRPRHESDSDKEAKSNAKAAASRRIFRIRFPDNAVDPGTGHLAGGPEITPSTELARLMQAQPELKEAFDRELERNGLTVEGIAVRDGQLYVGMRGPVITDRPVDDSPRTGDAAVLVVPVATVFDRKPGNAGVKRVDLGRDKRDRARGIRDMTAYEGGFLLLAGPVNDPPKGEPIPKGDYSVYLWDGSSRAATLLADLGGFEPEQKPEALLPLDRSGSTARALLFFDGPREGAPTPVTFELR